MADKDTMTCEPRKARNDKHTMADGLVLAFDTASEHIALAVGRWGESPSNNGHPAITVLASDNHPATRQANVQLMPSIDALLKEHKLSKASIVHVVCGLGPGSFTGVRIGVATAKGVARGLGVALHGVSTLDAVAWEAWAGGLRGRIGVVADAMRGEVYPARFDLSETGVLRLDAHAVTKAESIAQQWSEAQEQLLLLGDGLHKYADAFSFDKGGTGLWVPTGRGLLLAFEAACAQGTQGSGEVGTLLPVYTRLSDAEENERKRLASGGQIAQGALITVPRCGVTNPKLEAFTLRPMAYADLEQISALEAQSFVGGSQLSGEKWSRELFANELTQKNRTWWVAYTGDTLVGFAGALVGDGTLQILDVCVAPLYRRRGIAAALLSHVMRDGKDLGAERALLEVRENNVAAQALYSSKGFDVLGVRKDYFSPLKDIEREHALIMGKSLLEGALGGSKAPRVPASAPTSTPVSVPTSAPLILAIETSCDETAAAVIDGTGKILSDIIASQVDFHARFGGVVPEIASRKHTEAIVGVVDAAFDKAGLHTAQQLSAIAVTYAPGLIGALVVGVAFAKGLAWATDLPLIRVNHLEGHIYANRFAESDEPLAPPFIIALLSGGHTMLVHVQKWGDYRILGQTLDDAVGEAFDKIAKALGLGYPGGPIISKLALQGNPQAIDFPRALLHSHDYCFSLSGLKTAVITYIKAEEQSGRKLNLPDIAASFEQAVIDVQVAKALAALEETSCNTFCLGGGVAANRALREAYINHLSTKGIRVVLPPKAACTDNAAMIALVALDRFNNKQFMKLSDDAFAQTDLESPY